MYPWPQRCHSEQPLRSVASASLMLFRAVVEECPLGLSDADLNGHRGDCTLNDGRSERPSSTRGLGAGTLYAGAVPGYRRISANGPLLASSDELIISQSHHGVFSVLWGIIDQSLLLRLLAALPEVQITDRCKGDSALGGLECWRYRAANGRALLVIGVLMRPTGPIDI
ncbi:hypothetical protein PGTUg99_004336 [Puccinia graminis f. sp. tritici]|uniref:Uncharacterized protein n=1 Tax=Puccinia graminis f. sp. tritici TaxID=56615 RepID=A0A5B0PDN2_PUCGR|nr:hypothetical protein PGTUg99_000727 [Puccinia graminis f. sp. tritici]KAA1099156.1 hypothetical protein PGTUg99_004336 [Puccinia graminis f. sp. tritici]